MNKLILTIDEEARDNIKALKKHYGMRTEGALIEKALGLLKTAARVENSKGKLVAKVGDKEMTIIVK